MDFSAKYKAWYGQAGRQSPQAVQQSAATTARFWPKPFGCAARSLSALSPQAATQRPQPVQCSFIWGEFIGIEVEARPWPTIQWPSSRQQGS